MSKSQSSAYQALCAQYYELDKPSPSEEALKFYLKLAAEAQGPILEPMCGSGRFFIPISDYGYDISGFDSSQHMLDLCLEKCKCQSSSKKLFLTNFKQFLPKNLFRLVFIPAGSFCLLINKEDAEEALQVIFNCMEKGGKFVLEVDTPKSISASPGIWKGRWVNKPDGTKLVLSTLSNFNSLTKIETTLCRYETWEKNKVSQIEVEELQVRVYDDKEIESLLFRHQFQIIKKIEPYTSKTPNKNSETILYICEKS